MLNSAKKQKTVFILFSVALLFNVFLLFGRYYVTGSVVGGDSVYYYMNIRSGIIDGDLDFSNEYKYFHNKRSEFTGNRKVETIPEKNPITGKLPNKYPVGTAILLAPFFIAAHIVTMTFSSLGFSLITYGYSGLYQLMTGLGSVFYGFCGILLIYYYGKKMFRGIGISLVAVMAVWLATPLLYYMTMEPLMSHTLSFFVVTLFFVLWLKARKSGRMITWGMTGLAAGMMSIVRYQDAFLLLLPLVDQVYKMIMAHFKSVTVKKELKNILIFTAFVFLLVSIQLIVNKYLYGDLFITGYESEGFSFWTTPQLLYTLFSSQSGLILWAPVTFFSLVGLLLFAARSIVGKYFLFAFIIQWYLISSWTSVDQGDSFGNRMLLNLTIVFAVGLMEIVKRLSKKKVPLKYPATCAGGFILLNIVLIGLYSFRIIGSPY